MRKNFFPLRVTEPWPRLPREVVESPLEIFQTRLDAVLCSLLWVTLLRQGVGLGDPRRALPTPTMLGFCEAGREWVSVPVEHGVTAAGGSHRVVDLWQVEDLDRLNIIHVTGTKGKVRWAALGGGLPVSLAPFAPAAARGRGSNAAISPGLSMRLHRVHPAQLRAEDRLLQVGGGVGRVWGGRWHRA